MKTVELICAYCGKAFLRDSREAVRNAALHRPSYCNLSCLAIAKNKTMVRTPASYQHLIADNTKYQYTGFREFMRRVKKRFKDNAKRSFTITLEDLKRQWELQQGICPYSGIKLVLPNRKPDKLNLASLDRIDSSKGYHPDNIQFVLSYVNLMKSTLTHEETLELCKIIAEHYNTTH